MDGMNFSDLSAIITALRDNPQMLQMLSSLISSQQPKPKPEPQSSINPDALSSLMSMLGGSKNADDRTRNAPNASPPLKLSSVFGSQEEIKNRIILLNAVRPYLSETRKERLEAVIKLLRLAELGGLSSLLG